MLLPPAQIVLILTKLTGSTDPSSLQEMNCSLLYSAAALRVRKECRECQG